jgi:DNA topoisomerase-1
MTSKIQKNILIIIIIIITIMIYREKNSSGVYVYYAIENKNKKRIISDEILSRISKLKIPPMWKSVEISEDPTEYLQVTGTDLSGKVQYIYHPLFISLTEFHKFNRIKQFCIKLPMLFSRINNIKKTNIRDRQYLIGLMFKIMLKTHARVGNDHYLESEGSKKGTEGSKNPEGSKKGTEGSKKEPEGSSSYGLTTLNNKHIKIDSDNIILDFIGKHGIRQYIEFSDKNIARDLLELKKINKDRIFIDSNESCIRSNDMNTFIKETLGDQYSCKDFRTFASNVLFIEIIIKLYESRKTEVKEVEQKELLLKEANKLVAKELGHSDAISKKSYIIPTISEKFIEDEKYFKKSKDPVKLLINLI